MIRQYLRAALKILITIGLFTISLAATSSARNSTPVKILASPLQQLDFGQTVYTEHCEICHGVEGDGNGSAAVNMDPKPRDFRRGWYKIRTTASGQLPTDDDLFQIISNGMPGTTMPAWRDILTDQEIQAVVEYIKSFSRRFDRETPAEVEVGQKIESNQESITRGKDIFLGEEAECVKCHGNAGRGDGPSADELVEDFFGDVIVPADLTMPWLFRGGATVEDIYMRLKTGLTGSPMPSYADVLSDENVWHLANYVDSLAPDNPPELEPMILSTHIQGDIPDDPKSQIWESSTQYFYPLVSQIMREPRNYTSTVKGVWVRALHNEQEIALLVRWHDRFYDTGQDDKPPDGLAVQFPAELSESDELPYFVFGDQTNPINLWVWSAATNTIEERIARGSGTEVLQDTQDLQGEASFADGEYTLIVRRSLRTTDSEDIQFTLGRFIPISFFAWDGWRGEQIETGSISSWFLIYLDKPLATNAYVWIPAAIFLTALIEAGAVWVFRRGASRNGSEREN